MEIATKSVRRRWRHVDDGGVGRTLALLEAAKGKAKASDTTSENHGGHSGATFAYAANPFKVLNSFQLLGEKC